MLATLLATPQLSCEHSWLPPSSVRILGGAGLRRAEQCREVWEHPLWPPLSHHLSQGLAETKPRSSCFGLVLLTLEIARRDSLGSAESRRFYVKSVPLLLLDKSGWEDMHFWFYRFNVFLSFFKELSVVRQDFFFNRIAPVKQITDLRA